MTDRGAKALAEGLTPFYRQAAPEDVEVMAKVAIGEHGLFIPDVTAHEPLWRSAGCLCGYTVPNDESFFDHLNP